MPTKLYIPTAPIYWALSKMALFSAAAVLALFAVRVELTGIFASSPVLNGAICAMFVLGLFLSFRAATSVAKAAEYLNSTPPSRDGLPFIAAHLDSRRLLPGYISGTLVFVGLFGTFWGLLTAISSLGDLSAIDLSRPLSGMATSLSTSLFGLLGSLVLGFLQLQCSAARRYFDTAIGALYV